MQNYMSQNTMLVVLAIILIIWLGIAIYLFLIDRKLNKFEKITETHHTHDE